MNFIAYICRVNLKALSLVILFLGSQFFAIAAGTEPQSSHATFHFSAKKSGKNNGNPLKSISAFEVEEEEESGLEFLKRNSASADKDGIPSEFKLLIFSTKAQRYFTHCVSGFRHVRTYLRLRSIRI